MPGRLLGVELLDVAQEEYLSVRLGEPVNAGPDLCAANVQRYGAQGHDPRPAFDLLLKYSISEDGALHAEKYYRTVAEDFHSTRAAFQWRHLVALARVVASEYGFPAPGYQQACELLKV